MTALPAIDIAPLLAMDDAAAVERTAAAIGAASADYGFFYVEGHGIADALFDRLEAVSHRFFALSEAEKAEIAMAHGGTAWRGWFPLGGELTSGRPDRKEGLYLGEELGDGDPRVAAGWPLHGANLWPSALPELRPAVEEYLAASVAAAEALMRGMALALGLSADHFANELTRRPTLLFRIFTIRPMATPTTSGSASTAIMACSPCSGRIGTADWRCVRRTGRGSQCRRAAMPLSSISAICSNG